MIKLINYTRYSVTDEYISKHFIHSMKRDDDFTCICMDGGYSLRVKETPEEILAMPDIEATEKVVDWEQRRYEIAKNIMPFIYEYGKRSDVVYYAKESVKYADALINELKKGGEK